MTANMYIINAFYNINNSKKKDTSKLKESNPKIDPLTEIWEWFAKLGSLITSGVKTWNIIYKNNVPAYVVLTLKEKNTKNMNTFLDEFANVTSKIVPYPIYMHKFEEKNQIIIHIPK